MTKFDIILTIILSGFAFYGLYSGLIRTLGYFLGIFIGAAVAFSTYQPIFDWLEGYNVFFGYLNIGKLGIILIIFSLASKLVSFLFFLLDRTYDLLSILPFLGSINRLGGMILGFVLGTAALGAVFYVSNIFIGQKLAFWSENSQLMPIVSSISSDLFAFFPLVWKGSMKLADYIKEKF